MLANLSNALVNVGPAASGGLLALSVLLGWMAFRPSRTPHSPEDRLATYLQGGTDVVQEEILRQPFFKRAVVPIFRQLLRLLGRLAPSKNATDIQRMLVQAGQPGGLSVMDFYGLRLLFAALLGGGFWIFFGVAVGASRALWIALVVAFIGAMLPKFWLGAKVRGRQHAIQKALPDALDMLTIGVEAGLGFESAMMRVGERWENALTQEFRRAVAEMRVGTSREEALTRMSERSGVPDLKTFVAVLVQSTRLGVSIAEVLHTQADQMRIKRRQRAQELAQKAAIKMVFPLVFFIFPALFVVILGPAMPRIMEMFGGL